MTISSTSRCSYYLVLILSLGSPALVSAADDAKAAKLTPAAADAAPAAKNKVKTRASEEAGTKPDWVASPPSGAAAPATVEKGAPAGSAKDPAAAPSSSADKPAETASTPAGAEGEVCPPNPEPVPDLPRSDTYKNMPFQPGEEARYILKYGLVKVHVGYGFLRVMPPTKYSMPVAKKNGSLVEEGRWHRVFAAEAYTGDWYKMIFAGHDKMQAFSRPWDFGVTKFYISQNEEKPFVRRFHAEKWLDFDHVNCVVHERMVDHKKNRETVEDHFLQPSADDALGALYKLRTFNWELNKTERILVYTSTKNWWLEATPLALETVETKAGNFKAYKLTVKTYLGKELQQRGKLFVWIAADHPSRPMVRVEGEVTFGSIYLELDKFAPGAAL